MRFSKRGPALAHASNQRESPQGKPGASLSVSEHPLCSSERETPQGEPGASLNAEPAARRILTRSVRSTVWLLIVAIASPAAAAPPSARSINLRGLQIGGTTTIVVDGTDLLPNPRVVMSVPIAAQ